MKVMVDFCVVPIGAGVSLGSYVAECEKVLIGAGVKTRLHGYGTNIEGEWDQVMQALKDCHERLHKMGVPRISSSIRLGTRVDREETIAGRIRSVREKLNQPQAMS